MDQFQQRRALQIANGVLIPKGTLVRITTINGGEAICHLEEDHRRTYDAVVVTPMGYGIIPGYRIATIDPVTVH